MSAAIAVQAPAPACTDEGHERVKWTARWAELVPVGVMDDGDGGKLELRNCTCGSTLCKPVPPAAERSTPIADVAMDATDAMAVGQTLRALARDKKTPLGVRELFAKVGSQMTAAARIALAQAKAGV